MTEGAIFSGVLEGCRTYHGATFVVLKHGKSEILLSPHEFPYPAWIEEHRGRTVHVVMNRDGSRSIKGDLDPSKAGVTVADDRVAVQCVACDAIVCYAPRPGTVAPEVAQEALRPFATHLKEKHPELLDDIKKAP